MTEYVIQEREPRAFCTLGVVTIYGCDTANRHMCKRCKGTGYTYRDIPLMEALEELSVREPLVWARLVKE